jgi:hypothetical protein
MTRHFWKWTCNDAIQVKRIAAAGLDAAKAKTKPKGFSDAGHIAVI